jgi:pseudomonalisin
MTTTTLRSSRFASLALAIAVSLAATGIPAYAAANNIGVAAVAHATELRQGDVVTGAVPEMQPMHIVIALKLRNREQLDSLVAAHQILKPGQYATQHEPTQMQAQAVVNYLTRSGFTNIVVSPNRLLVSADGTAGNAATAFLTSFNRVHTKEGRIAFANTSDAYIPAALQDSVLSVVGLQNVFEGHVHSHRLLPGTDAHTLATGITGHFPIEFQSIYEASGLPTAANITVGIFAVGDVSQTITDLNTSSDNNGQSRVVTEVVNNGTSNNPNDIGEWDLDSQTIVGMGGGKVGKLIFYSGTDWSNPSVIATLNQAMTANAAKIINNSWGGCETSANSSGAAAATDQIFQLAIAQGQTFAFSTGDNGAYECGGTSLGAEWPASSPYVVAVAGTTLDASTTTWAGEIVWNHGFGATGGSPSAFEPKPNWQNVLVPGTTRGVADVAFDADQSSGVKVVWYGGPSQWGGTSVSAPIFSGLWARVIAAKGEGLGFAAPWLYLLPASDFHDVTTGNNNGYSAKVGYDFASGRGSVIASKMIRHIGIPNTVAANFSYTNSGLIGKFTDKSTDSAHPITSHAWTFGDGGTSTLADPSHFYSKPGIYSVTEFVSDSVGNSDARIASVTVAR